jgi:hypothetical protein
VKYALRPGSVPVRSQLENRSTTTLARVAATAVDGCAVEITSGVEKKNRIWACSVATLKRVQNREISPGIQFENHAVPAAAGRRAASSCHAIKVATLVQDQPR